MNTWTFKRSVIPVFLGGSLVACTPQDGAFNLLDVFQRPEQEVATRPNVALRSAKMMQGGLKLLPPDGFCLDKLSLRQDFAVMARCDSLGGAGGAQDASLGMIVVSIASAPEPVDVETSLRALIPTEAEVLLNTTDGDLALAHLSGASPDGSDSVHWRGLTQIGAHLVSLAAFAPQDGAFSSPEGAQALSSVVTRSAEASAGLEEVTDTGPVLAQAGLGARIRGLFNRKPSPE